MTARWNPELEKNSLIDEILQFEEIIKAFDGPTTRRKAKIIKRIATLSNFSVMVEDENGSQFSIICPKWLYDRAELGTKVELMFELVKSGPDEYRERILGINKLSPSGNHAVSWAAAKAS